MANEIAKLPLSKLKPNPDNVKIFNMAKIDALAQSIKKDGFIGAIEVIKVDKDTYEILSSIFLSSFFLSSFFFFSS